MGLWPGIPGSVGCWGVVRLFGQGFRVIGGMVFGCGGVAMALHWVYGVVAVEKNGCAAGSSRAALLGRWLREAKRFNSCYASTG